MTITLYESKIFSFERGFTARVNTSISTGKWYWEITIDHGQHWDSVITSIGVGRGDVLPQQIFSETTSGWGIDSSGVARHAGVGSGEVLPSYRNATIYGKVTVGIALDMDEGYLWAIVADEWGKYDHIGDPAAGTDPHITGITGNVYPMVSLQAFDDKSASNVKMTANFGKLPFKHEVPFGFEVLIGPSSSSSSSVSSSSFSSSSSSRSNSSSSLSSSFSLSFSSTSISSSSSMSNLSFSSFSFNSNQPISVKVAQLVAQVEVALGLEEGGSVKVAQLVAQVEVALGLEEGGSVKVAQLVAQIETQS